MERVNLGMYLFISIFILYLLLRFYFKRSKKYSLPNYGTINLNRCLFVIEGGSSIEIYNSEYKIIVIGKNVPTRTFPKHTSGYVNERLRKRKIIKDQLENFLEDYPDFTILHCYSKEVMIPVDFKSDYVYEIDYPGINGYYQIKKLINL